MSLSALARLELSRAARRDSTWWIRALYVTLLATVVAASWWSETGATRNWTEREAVGAGLFLRFSWAQFLLLNFAAFASLCGAICVDRDRGALPLLLTTRLGALRIAAGKLLGGLAPVFLLLLSGLPVLFCLLAFGQLSPQRILGVCVLCALSAAFAGSLALLASCLSRRPAGAFVCSIGLWTLCAVLLPGQATAALQALLDNPQLPSLPIVAQALVVPSAGCLLALGLSARLLGRVPRDRKEAWRRVWLRPIFRRRAAGRIALAEGADPVLWIEAGGWAGAVAGGLRQAVWLGVALLVLVIFSPGQFLGARGGGHAWLWPALSALLLLPFVFSGVRAIAEERERGALGVLLAQPLSGASVIGGKTKACFARAALPFAGVLAVSVAFACARCLPPAAPLLLALLLPAGALFLYGAGLVAGLLCSGAPAALAWCCVFCAVVEAGAVGAGLGAILCGFEVGVMRTGLFYWLVPGWPDLLQNGGLDRGGWLAAVVALGGRAGLGIAACFWAMRRFDRWTGRA